MRSNGGPEVGLEGCHPEVAESSAKRATPNEGPMQPAGVTGAPNIPQILRPAKGAGLRVITVLFKPLIAAGAPSLHRNPVKRGLVNAREHGGGAVIVSTFSKRLDRCG